MYEGPGNFYSYFEGTAGKQTVLRVGPGAALEGSRTVTVVPVSARQGWGAADRGVGGGESPLRRFRRLPESSRTSGCRTPAARGT